MPSFAKRYAAKLVANIGGLMAGALVVLVAPRALGAADYGLAEFLFYFFVPVIGVVELGTSIGYYVRLSGRQDDAGLVRGYLILSLGVYAIVVTLILAAFATGIPATWLWPGIALAYVLAGSLAAWLAWLQQVAQRTLDARALTVRGEMRILLCRLVGVGFLVAAAISQTLTLNVYLGYLIILPFATTFLLAFTLRREVIAGGRWWVAVRSAPFDWRRLLKDFEPYVVPMLAYNVVTSATYLADRWLLQRFSGTVEQGLFSLGNRISALCFVFSAAMAQLLTREFAMVWERGDKAALAKLFSRYVPPLYAVSALIASFVAWHAQTIVVLIGGQEFAAGAAAMTIFAFYPMHQTLGQLAGAVFYATASMRIFARVGIVGALLGVPLLWLLIAPAELGGSALGSLGLATKMVVIQIIFVNILIFFIARNFGLNFGRQLIFQFVSPGVCTFFAMTSAWLASLALPPGGNGFLLSGLLYLVLALVASAILPMLFGIERDDMRTFFERIRNRLRAQLRAIRNG